MRNMTLENIAKAASGLYVGPEDKKQACIEGAVLDSRKVEKDYLFIATKGERVDGHSFIHQVYEKGAICVICERPLEASDVPDGMEACYIQVEDSFIALKEIATFYRRQLDIKVVGITGSVGKTSTKEMIGGVLSAKYNVLKTAGNFNNEVGLPLTVLGIRDEHEIAVLEMGISDFGEMSRLTRIANPDICVITNIGQCHLENLKTRDGILKAKTEIFEGLKEDGYAVLNGEDDKLITVKEVCGRTPLFFGDESCYASDVESKGIFGTSCKIHLEGDTIKADIKVPGVHQIANAMAAVRVAKLLNLTISEMEKGIQSVEAIGGRNNIIQGDTYTVIDDCYNANPVSMKAALDLLALANTRKVAVLGDMFELGDNSDHLHAGVGEYGSQKPIDVIVCIGENAKHIYDGIGGDSDSQKRYHFLTKEEFLEKKDSILQKNDTLLLKASHGMHFETMIKELA